MGDSKALRQKLPPKYDLFGVQVSATDYQQVIDILAEAASNRRPLVATFHAVHAVITSSDDPELRRRVNSFDIVAPDGQPVRWALNWLHKTHLSDRVSGPDVMWQLCERAARDSLSIYLYGASPETLQKLCNNLLQAFPTLIIAGAESPPFRPLSKEEDKAALARINDSGAHIVFIGLGAPKQDHFAYEHHGHIQAIQLCVGAAFDFHAGVKRVAPDWMRRRGLEWLFRLGQEPGRLWQRYLDTNSRFLYKLARASFARNERNETDVE